MVADAAVPTLYDVSIVHISITDVNDNRPIFTHPSLPDNNTAVIQLTSSVHVGHVVTQVKASDADIGVNARLSYSIISDVSGNSQDVELFAVDEESGDVTVAAPLPYSSHSVMYNVVIAVNDAGTPSLTSHMALRILVSEMVSQIGPAPAVDVVRGHSPLSSTSIVTDVTWWIVAGGFTAGLLIIFTTLCLLVGINKRRQRKRRPRTHSTTTTTIPRTANLYKRETQPTPLMLMTDMDPLTSAMVGRHQFGEKAARVRRAEKCGNYVDNTTNTTSCGDVIYKSAPVSTSKL